MSWIGINIGALMVKVVGLRAHITGAEVQAHQGRPLEVLQELLARPEFAYGEYFGVCGQRGHIWNSRPPSAACWNSPTSLMPWCLSAGSLSLSTRSLAEESTMCCLTTSVRRVAANSLSSRSAGWVWRSTRRSSFRSGGKRCITHKLNRRSKTAP